MARALVTMYGRSTWGLFNSVWAAIKDHDYLPDKVTILTSGCDLVQAQVAGKMVEILLHEYGSHAEVKQLVVDDDEVRTISDTVLKLATQEKSAGNQVALDVTPARKMFVLGSVLAGWNKPIFDHVFYLHIGSLKNANRSYVEIPSSIQHAHDIMADLKKGGKEGGA